MRQQFRMAKVILTASLFVLSAFSVLAQSGAAGTHRAARSTRGAGAVEYRQVPAQTCFRPYRNLAARL